MIIDSHAHILIPAESIRFMAELVGSRGNPSKAPKVDDSVIKKLGEELLTIMDKVGTDIQFLSPRPYMQMHSLKPGRVPEAWTRHCNDLIARYVALFPDRFRGVAGLPQHMDEALELRVLPELRRCVNELGFVGCLINPDPTEGAGPTPPGLGDKFWYPLYEEMVKLDVPGLVHSAGSCSPRESYTLKFINEESIAIMSMITEKTFEAFPKLKIVIPHGGGAIPYQMGRFRSWATRRGDKMSFDEQLKQFYFDTCNYSQDSLELLIKVCGSENVLFATEKPGTGSAFDKDTGRDFDDLKPVIENIAWLTAAQRADIFECNCKRLYTRAFYKE